ncbi:MAG: TIGR00282 family metallophosphoesterase [Candidatus Omnitrophica bacterium]|nr:TIGR00282 family metallophosphoesterase [Candidatus Omnitrophota bacterium]
MKILLVGDIVGRPGREAVKKLLPGLVKKKNIEFVVANGENAAGGSGMTPAISEELLSYGIDVLTSGDHIWKKKEIMDYIATSRNLLRPLNYPKEAPGWGSTVVKSKNNFTIAVVNLAGRVFMSPLECPFRTVAEEVKKLKERTSIIVVDFHAEATSEKIALGWHLDGKVSALIGTHTHVQTADEKILPEGTAYITDAGMTGPFDGVIGRKKEQILTRFITEIPIRFEMAEGDIRLNGVIVDVDEKTGKALAIERVEAKLKER